MKKKYYYYIDETFARINIYSQGKLVKTTRFRRWYNENGEEQNNIASILKKYPTAKQSISKRHELKILYNLYPSKDRVGEKYRELRDKFSILKKYYEGKSYSYLKKWFLRYKPWSGYQGGWDNVFECSNSSLTAYNNGLLTKKSLPSCLKKYIKQYGVTPQEKHHIKVNGKTKLIDFYSPDDFYWAVKIKEEK